MILCLLNAADIYQFFFLKILLINTSLFSRKMLKKMKKVNILVIFGSKITGKCQKHETNMILCLLHATDIYQSFLKNFPHKHFTFIKKNVEKMKKKVKFLVIFGSKKKLVNVRSMKQT